MTHFANGREESLLTQFLDCARSLREVVDILCEKSLRQRLERKVYIGTD